MKVRFFDPGKGYMKLKGEINGEIKRVLKAGDLILRKDVEVFENTLAEYIGTKYAVALNSCTDALYLSLRALKIGPGDKVFVPSRTFVATAQVVVQVGATPIFYDLDGHSEENIKNAKAVILVHIEGAMQENTEEMAKFCQENGIWLIEDAAQALGARVGEKMAGSIGDAGCFSFYPAKILGAYGDAGALVTDNKEIYEWVKGARNHFKEDARDWGVNSRMDNLQAAILNVKFKYLLATLQIRKNIAEMYDYGLAGVSPTLKFPLMTSGRVWQDYIIRLGDRKERDGMYEFLKEKGVETIKNNYPFPVPKMPLAQKYEDSTLRLPCNELLEDEEVNYVIDCVREFYD